jgi:hypothetical protein
MRFGFMVLTLPLALVAASAGAKGLLDTHFGASAKFKGDCFQREYSRDHLAAHPDQRVMFINLAPVPLDAPKGQTLMNVMIGMRGGSYYSSFAYCAPQDDRLECGMEGDAGVFTLTGETDSALLLTVGPYGLTFEGQTDFVTLDADRGDDRSFLIPNVESKYCQ